jgi:hypothetical protein
VSTAPAPAQAPTPTPGELLLWSLAAYRLARLASEDEILLPLRARVVERYRGRRPAYLATCMHCTGVWAAAAVVAAASAAPRCGPARGTLRTVGAVLAVSGAVSLARDVVDR